MSKQNKSLKCPKCGAWALHPFLKIPGTNEPRALIIQNKEPGLHHCLVCSGFYEQGTYYDTWQNHNEDLGWFDAEESSDDSVEELLTDMQTLVFKWFSQFIPAEDAEEITRQIMKRRKLLNATIEMIREEEK
tara:strand:+ start:203 stop:598 length:396 start_codon:yes stop_codon:yes gene_type:complete